MRLSWDKPKTAADTELRSVCGLYRVKKWTVLRETTYELEVWREFQNRPRFQQYRIGLKDFASAQVLAEAHAGQGA